MYFNWPIHRTSFAVHKNCCGMHLIFTHFFSLIYLFITNLILVFLLELTSIRLLRTQLKDFLKLIYKTAMSMLLTSTNNRKVLTFPQKLSSEINANKRQTQRATDFDWWYSPLVVLLSLFVSWLSSQAMCFTQLDPSVEVLRYNENMLLRVYTTWQVRYQKKNTLIEIDKYRSNYCRAEQLSCLAFCVRISFQMFIQWYSVSVK